MRITEKLEAQEHHKGAKNWAKKQKGWTTLRDTPKGRAKPDVKAAIIYALSPYIWVKRTAWTFP